jgi:hypothetical protein
VKPKIKQSILMKGICMAWEVFGQKKKPSYLRKAPFLPRIGLYVDWMGYEVILKRVPMVETLLNALQTAVQTRQFTNSTTERIVREQLAEIKFPQRTPVSKTIDTTHRNVAGR